MFTTYLYVLWVKHLQGNLRKPQVPQRPSARKIKSNKHGPWYRMPDVEDHQT
jgi:hypothetical protein